MGRETSTFMIGVFVTIGILIGAGTIVWLGASRYFQKGATYVTYFDESVQGLSVDSSVKYRGVEVGRVEQIRVAADNNLIEVVMKIDLRDNIEKNTVAQLKAVGITGMVFIELNQKVPDEPDLSPRLAFAAEYPIIASRPSGIRQIFSKVDEIVDKIKELDFRGMSEQLQSAAKSINALVSDRRLTAILANLESTTVHLDATLAKIDTMVARGTIQETFDEAHKTLADTRLLVKSVRDTMQHMQLAETAVAAGNMVDSLDKTLRSSASDVNAASENLRRASETLARLMEKLYANPSDLIFSKPPVPRHKE